MKKPRSGNPAPFDCSDNLRGHEFRKGQSGNPRGKSKEQHQREKKNLKLATKVRGMMLERTKEMMEKDPEVNPLNANTLKLLRDTEDRALGTPTQTQHVESPNGTMSPTTVRRVIVDPTSPEEL